jgi:hypothetical protein
MPPIGDLEEATGDPGSDASSEPGSLLPPEGDRCFYAADNRQTFCRGSHKTKNRSNSGQRQHAPPYGYRLRSGRPISATEAPHRCDVVRRTRAGSMVVDSVTECDGSFEHDGRALDPEIACFARNGEIPVEPSIPSFRT